MSNEHHAVYEALLQAQENAEAVVLATVVAVTGSVPRRAGSKMLVWADGRIVGTVGGGAMEARVIEEAQAVLGTAQPRMLNYVLNSLDAGDPGICGGSVQVFIEPITTVPTLLVIGIGHVGKAVAGLGKWMGYRVVVADDRQEYCNPEYLPGMDQYLVCLPGEITQHITLNAQTYVAAVTRGLPVDMQLIPTLLASKAAYIGLIGSRRRWVLTAKALLDAGLSSEQIKRVRAPIGLELEAETPKEIAVSILAEIIMLQHGGTGQPMQSIDGVDELSVS